jgi:hypothetical protein
VEVKNIRPLPSYQIGVLQCNINSYSKIKYTADILKLVKVAVEITSKMMKGVPKTLLLIVALLAWAFSLASASDPSPLQDFCVAINDTSSDHAGIYISSLI